MVKDKKTTGFDSTRELGAGSVGRRTRMEAASSMAMVESASVSAYTESEAGTEYDELDVFKDGFGNNAIPLPGEATINRRFEKYLNSRENVTEEGRQQLRHLPLEDKWRLLNETAAPSPSHHASFYVEQLRRHMHPDMHTIKKINKKMVKDLTPVPKILQWLKEDLGSFDITFLTDFISSPNNGVDVLIEFLHDIQLHHNEGIPFVAGTTRKATGATIPKQYQDTLKRKPKDKLDCLECLMDIIESSEEGSRLFTDSKKSMETLSQSLMDISMQIRILALQIMTLLCSNKDGHDYVLNTMTYIKLKMGESMRFKLLITMLHAEPPNRNFQLVCLRFLNKLLNSTQNVNERAYLQYELLQLANFDPYALQPLQGTYDEEIAQELELWHNEFIDIQGLHDDFKQLENRNKLLRKEVTMLTAKIKTLETEYEDNRLNLSEIKQSNEQYRLKVAVLQDKLQDAVRRHQNSKSRGEDIEHVYDETANTGLTGDGISTTDDGYDDGESSRSSLPVLAPPLTSNLEGPAPPPPPPPPSARLIGNERKKRTIRSNVPLPMLNWIPMTAAGNTVFKEVDDENVLKEVDFRDFEDRFQTRQRSEGSDVTEKLERARKRLEEQVTVIEKNRSKNLIITKRRISHMTDREIKEAITKCDISENGVPGEIAELLLKFLPTREELRGLAKNADKYELMADAEKFMFKMARIDRYESRLKLMAFMGIYDDLIKTVSPQIDGVLRASVSVIESKKLRKLFEIILAFGNYMNSSRRGPAYGFRLESLSRISDTKNTKRTYSLLHYIVKTILVYYPNVAEWYRDIDVNAAIGVSLESISTDIHGLRKGMELARYEKEKQEENMIVSDFYANASDNVYEVSERFGTMQQRYTEVCLLFGEKSKSIEPTDFFKYMTDFIEDFKKAMGDIKTNDFGLYDEVRKPTQRSVVSVTREATPTGTTIFEKRRSSKPLTTAIIKPTPVSRRAPSRPSTNDDKSELVGNKDNSQRVFYEQRKMVNSSTLGMFAGEGQDSPNSQGRRPFLDANAEPYAQVEDDADSGIQEYPTSSVKKPLKSALKNTNAELQNGVSKTGSDLLDSKEKRDSDSVIRHNEVVYDTHIPSTRPAVTNKRRAPQPPILPGAENLLRQGNSGLGQNSIYTEADIKITPL